MSDKASTSAAAENAATGAGSATSASGAAADGASSTAAPKRAAAQGNPAFRMMGLPRLRLPSRNWLIFLSITGSIASAIIYDKYQTRRVREKWCNLVSHIPDEYLPTNKMPRKVTIYLAAPPGDGLRSSREHFHTYVKPVLVAAAMDWDVVEGRKEGDVRHKTAERIRKRRRRGGEGEPLSDEDAGPLLLVEAMREQTGTTAWDGVAGDLVIGRNTWKEYTKGLHEGWLGPTGAPKEPEAEQASEGDAGSHSPEHPSFSDAAVKSAVDSFAPRSLSDTTPTEGQSQDSLSVLENPPSNEKTAEEIKKEEEEKKKEEEEKEKSKPRHPPPYIQPSEYSTATPSTQLPDLLGPSIGIRLPHILGFRNTPIRIYRFFTRRYLADSIGRDVAAAILASYRPYHATSAGGAGTFSGEQSDTLEQVKVLEYEERDWWKTTYRPRKEDEESVWIEDMVLDERIASRMRAFQLTAEDEDRAKRLWNGTEKVTKRKDSEGD